MTSTRTYRAWNPRTGAMEDLEVEWDSQGIAHSNCVYCKKKTERKGKPTALCDSCSAKCRHLIVREMLDRVERSPLYGGGYDWPSLE